MKQQNKKRDACIYVIPQEQIFVQNSESMRHDRRSYEYAARTVGRQMSQQASNFTIYDEHCHDGLLFCFEFQPCICLQNDLVFVAFYIKERQSLINRLKKFTEEKDLEFKWAREFSTEPYHIIPKSWLKKICEPETTASSKLYKTAFWLRFPYYLATITQIPTITSPEEQHTMRSLSCKPAQNLFQLR